MYWGSVRFFKHLILVLFFGIILAAILLTSFWGYRYARIRGEQQQAEQTIQQLREENQQVALALQELQQGNTEPFVQYLQQAGLSDSDLAALVSGGGGSPSAPGDKPEQRETEQPAYTSLYPELYVTPPEDSHYESNMVYLTFDDGPSYNTDTVLEVLEQYQIKATFFVCPEPDGSDAERMRKIVQAGHTIGVHSSSHSYADIYSDVESYLADFAETSRLIEEATGVKPEIFRFPGGSINQPNRLLYKSLITEMTRRGYTYFDWSVDGAEMAKGATASSIYATVTDAMLGRERAIVLLHDGSGRDATAAALGDIILTLQQRGYRFDRLTKTVQPIVFGYTLD